jgi:uncharacterized protein (TIGR02246 family)
MDKDEQAIRTLVETWLRATREGNVDEVLDLMTDDVVFLVPGQDPMVGKQTFAATLRSVLGNHAIDSTSEIDEIAVFGDIAYCRARLEVTVTRKHDNLPTLRKGQSLSILRRCADGKWRVTRDANMVVAA